MISITASLLNPPKYQSDIYSYVVDRTSAAAATAAPMHFSSSSSLARAVSQPAAAAAFCAKIIPKERKI